MKIVKLVQHENSYYAIFDKTPPLTYEKIGYDYVGSSFSEEGVIVQSRFLKKGMLKNAFGGNELFLTMKDGSEERIQHYWMDRGAYRQHGDFVNIGAETEYNLKKFGGFYDFNINRKLFDSLVEEYLLSDKVYSYDEFLSWVDSLKNNK